MAGKIKALLIWCQNNTKGYRDVNVVNMTTSWKDGLAFCALIHHFRPDLIDFNSLSKENILHNNNLAFHTAEDELGIAALLDADDMVEMRVPDKLSIITYVSQYYNCLHTMQPAALSLDTGTKAPKRSASPVPKLEQVEVKKKPLETKAEVVTSQSKTAEKPQVFSTCEICGKKVHLVERFIDEGKVYHRQCHRTKSLSGMYHRRSDVSSHKLQDNAFGNTPDVVEKNSTGINYGANGVNDTSKPRSSSSISPLSSVDNTSTTTNLKKSPSKVHEMANVFEKNARLHRGLKGNGDSVQRSENVSPTTLSAANATKTDNKRETLLPAEGSTELTGQMKQVKSTANDLSLVTPEKSRSPGENNEPNHIANGMVAPDTLAQKPDTVDPKNVLPGLLKSLSDVKQHHKGDSAKSDDVKETPSAQKIDQTSDDEKKHILPSLLESLAGVKETEITSGNKALTDSSSDTSPTSAFVPLISELPKVPEAKPRSRTTSSEPPVAIKPIPRKRSQESSSDSKRSSTTYDTELNPFESTDPVPAPTAMPAEKDRKPSIKSKRKPYNKSLNPFANEESSHDSSATSTNPFEEEDVVKEKSPKPHIEPTRNSKRTGTVNIVNSNDARLNPFTDEYEGRKHSPNPPMPPSRRKTAPKPPGGPSPHSDANVSPSKSAKASAPDWKQDVEKKMEQINSANLTDTKYVEKAKETPANKSENRKSGRRPIQQTSKAPSIRNQIKSIKPSRPAPGFGFPLVKRKVKSQMTEEEITNEMTILDIQLKDLEKKGVKLEEVLREEMELDLEAKSDTDNLLGDWFELVQEKNKLVRRETDLVYLMQQQRLEQEHADVEFKIRKLMNKPDSKKSEEEKEEESKLLEKLVEIVERRNTIINSIEEARLKEEEEDAAYDKLRSMPKDLAMDADSSAKKKKKSKIKKVFGKKKKSTKSPPSSTNSEDQPPPS